MNDKPKHLVDEVVERQMNLPGNRVWIYVRFSPGDNQTIDSQLLAIENYCRERNWIIDRVFRDEWKSGKSAEDRDAFMLMISQSKLEKKTAGAIVMWDTKRFSRNAWDAQFYRSMLRKNGWKLIFIQDNIPDDPFLGPLMEVLLDIMAQQQLSDIKAGTLRGFRYIIESGCLPNGQPAIGYITKEVALGGVKKDGSLRMGRKAEIDQQIAPLIKAAFELKARGAPTSVIEKETGLFSKSHNLKNDDEDEVTRVRVHKTSISGSWNHFFQNRAYIGEYYFHGEVFYEVYPAIISKELFNAVQDKLPPRKLRERKISDHPRRKHSQYLVASFSFCGYCGAPMEGKSMTGRKKGEIRSDNPREIFRYLVCSKHNENSVLCMESGLVDVEAIETQLFEVMTKYTLQKEYLKELLLWTNKQLNAENEDLFIRITEMRNRLVQEDHLNKKIHRNFLMLEYPTKQAEKQLREQDKLVESMRTELEKMEELYKQSHIETTDQQIEEFVLDGQALLSSDNVFDKKAVYERLIDRITVFKDRCIVSVHFPVIQ